MPVSRPALLPVLLAAALAPLAGTPASAAPACDVRGPDLPLLSTERNGSSCLIDDESNRDGSTPVLILSHDLLG